MTQKTRKKKSKNQFSTAFFGGWGYVSYEQNLAVDIFFYGDYV